MTKPLFVFFLLYLITIQTLKSTASQLPPLPLSTTGRWIVDASGHRAKLACVNWAAHMEAAAAEGLSKQPLDAISEKIAEMGFNCVRLTWPTRLLTNSSLASLSLRSSFAGVGLADSAAAVAVNNPQLLDLTLVQVFQAVVSNLGRNGIMVILDNQITIPGWCCSKYDGNGFFGDRHFDPAEWLKGLSLMATMFSNSANVVGMSLRNELRGPYQNVTQWYRYMHKGAEVVHAANPNVLVILSGLDYDKDLSFLSEKQVKLTFTKKLVFEIHWYGFSDGGDWDNGNINEVCASVSRNFTRKGGFLLEQGWPLFLSEFGGDVSGTHVSDNRFLSCLASVAAELDLDWALWALQGSYYIREGQLDYDESYGILSFDWCMARNTAFLQRLSALQSPFQGPGLSNMPSYHVIFHPLTGLCVLRKSLLEPLQLGSCSESEAWDYTSESRIILKDTNLCLQAENMGEVATLGEACSVINSKWELISGSKMQLSVQIFDNGDTLCLDADTNGVLLTTSCACLNQNGTCSSESQWFKFVQSTRDVGSMYSSENSASEGTRPVGFVSYLEELVHV